MKEKDETLEGIQVHDNVSNPKAPLVIDLPDGQKLLVGELPAGSVVEIATWRGTGRPDSRTTRLLLGVTNEEQQQSNTSPARESSAHHVDMRSRSERRKSQQRRFKFNLGPIALPAIVIGGLVIAFILSPLTMVSPTVGASIGFGSADSSLVIAGPLDTPAEGQVVVAPLGETGEQIVMGRVSAVADQDILIQTDTGFAQAEKNSVIGRVLVVIPFLGRVF